VRSARRNPPRRLAAARPASDVGVQAFVSEWDDPALLSSDDAAALAREHAIDHLARQRLIFDGITEVTADDYLAACQEAEAHLDKLAAARDADAADALEALDQNGPFTVHGIDQSRVPR
jgi:hypothetical protein